MDTRSQKKILILYASAGHGHEKAARAIFEAFQDSGSGHEVKILDALSLTLPLVGRFYRWVYFTQIKYAPWLWGFSYYSTDCRWVYFFIRYARRAVNQVLGSPLHAFLEKENPDVIVTTHFLSTEIASFLKGRKKITSKLVTVVTDYLPHYVWTAPAVDFYAVAVEDTKKGLVDRGVPENRIRVTGIPIEKKFLESSPRKELLAKLGLEDDRFTVLITGGGAGIGGVEEMAERLSKLRVSLQILLVCGTNRALYERMSVFSKTSPFVRALSFVNNMQELMEVSDVVIGKGGGLTVTESFAKGKPLILFRSVLGQERRNDRVVERYGAGFATNSVEEVVKKVSEIAQNPELRAQMAENVKRLSKPKAAEAILRIVRDER
ncbi:MAG: hypothetical protein A3C47_01275 [Omnitrophica bacterium RIFCSPHIGHO2_02_FULL_51_18]|nr:MAG: hypothetical protein A3C47_01275 [Omnitrophica bacterium RIFCSPHIGHO2_02_FULL_51_18]